MKAKHLYIYICLITISLSTLLFAYWLFWPVKVTEIMEPVTVDRPEYKPGDTIVYTVSYCKYKAIIGTSYRSLVNGTRTYFTESATRGQVGCHKVQFSDLIIPSYSDDGLYHLESTIVYEVNPLRQINVSWKSEEFIIKK